MEATISGRVWLVCTLLFLALGVCMATVEVKVTPQLDVIKGQTARLPCTYSASETTSFLLVEWYIENAGGRQRVAFRSTKDSGQDIGTPLTGRVKMESDMTLIISNTNTADQRVFICSVVRGAVGTSEAETKLSVFYPPETPTVSGNTQPISIEGSLPSEVGTCISRNGHPAPRIIWFKDSIPLPEVKDAKEKMYMVPRVVKEASGLFTVTNTLYMLLKKEDSKSIFHCTVEYTMPKEQIKQESSNNFTLSLLYPAENAFFTLLNEGPLKEGDDVHMRCSTDGNPQPQFEITKKEDDTALNSDESGQVTLKKVTRENSGKYSCLALDFDSSADLSKDLTVDIHYLDVEVDPTGLVNVNKEESVDLQCRSSSSDAFTLQWMKDDKTLSSKGTLSLTAVSLSDAGVYVCAVSVPSVPGLHNKANVTVTITGIPEIDKPMIGQVEKEGDVVTLKCSAKGYPPPQFTWTPSGTQSVQIEGINYISTVSLKATDAIIRSGVLCEATNTQGTDSERIEVEVKSESGNGAGRAHAQHGGSSGVVIAVVVCVLLLLLLVASLYFLGKKGKMACGKKDKMDTESGEMKQDALMNKKPTDNDGVEERLNKSGD